MANGKEIRCRHCRRKAGHKANHKYGFVVRSSNGMAILVGSTCGPKHYPDTWGLIHGHWTILLTRKNLLVRLANLQDN